MESNWFFFVQPFALFLSVTVCHFTFLQRLIRLIIRKRTDLILSISTLWRRTMTSKIIEKKCTNCNKIFYFKKREASGGHDSMNQSITLLEMSPSTIRKYILWSFPWNCSTTNICDFNLDQLNYFSCFFLSITVNSDLSNLIVFQCWLKHW